MAQKKYQFSLLATMQAMNLGESIELTTKDATPGSVRANASRLKKEQGREFHVKSSIKKGWIKIVREL